MTVDEIYKLVALNIFNSIKTSTWEKAVLNIHGGDNEMGYEGFYLSNNTNYSLEVNDFDLDVDFALMDLHVITTQEGSNLWNQAIFTLWPSGEFNIDFCWNEE